MAQVGGDHYDNMEIQPIDYIQSNGLSVENTTWIKLAEDYLIEREQKNG